MIRFAVAPVVAAIYGVPLLLVVGPALSWPSAPLIAGTLLMGPLIYATLFVLIAGTISVPFQRGIIPGKFPRDLRHPVYAARRMYGLCWTCVYYCKPVYFLCLTIPWMKWLTFRIFGYRGSMNFTIYPDTWIRDLPLLDFGDGAYLANRATLGSNVPTRDGNIAVGPIRVGRGALLGHLSVLGPGNELGEGSEVGPRCVFGVGVKLGRDVTVSAATGIAHHTTVGDGAKVGYWVYLGKGVRVGPRVDVPQGAVIPHRSSLETAEDVRTFFSGQVSADVAALLGSDSKAPPPPGQELPAKSSAA